MTDSLATAWWLWPIVLVAVTFVLGIVAAVAGIGGGVLFVPIVGSFLPFHLDFVRGAGLVLALSGTLAAGPVLLRSGLANLRLVMPLALAGSVASAAGALVGLALPTEQIQIALGVTVIAVAFLLWRSREAENVDVAESDFLGALLRLKGEVQDPAAGLRIRWRTHRTPLGLAVFGAIGFFGGVFGLGAGFANVPALNLLMGAPLKVAVASSGLIISIINSSAAWVYLNRGAVLPLLAVPSILGIMLGSRLGARLLGSTPAPVVRRVVIAVMLVAGVRALLRGMGLWN